MYKSLMPGAIGVKASLPEAISLAARHGFEGVDFNIADAQRLAAEQSPGMVEALFTGAGVRPGSWGLPVNWRGDEAAYRETLAQLGPQAELARSLGATRVTMWILSGSDERPFAENLRFHVERFRPVAQVLKDHGCRLGLEFLGPKTIRAGMKDQFIFTMQGMLEMCAQIGDNAGLLLDAWHWYTAHGSLADLDVLTNDQVVSVHVNDAPAGIAIDEQMDNVRCLPCETGVIDLAGFMRRLVAIGYDGPVTPEPFSKRVREMAPGDALRTTAAAMAAAWRAGGLA